MFKRIFNSKNLLPLFLTPIVIWGVDYFVHLNLGSFSSDKVWILILTLIMPLLGFVIVWIFYNAFSDFSEKILPPEVPGIIGFLYAQPIYMLLLKLGIGESTPISLSEIYKVLIALMPIVPFSNIMISTYDGTLFAVPLTCLLMVASGIICRKRRKGKK
jgi:hypothetical protein